MLRDPGLELRTELVLEGREAALHALSVGATEPELCWEERAEPLLSWLGPLSFRACAPLREAVGGDRVGAVFGEVRVRGELALGPLELRSRVVGVYDLGRMGIVAYRSESARAEIESHIWYTSEGGFGGPRPPRAPRLLPQGPPAREASLQTSPSQALWFRLQGDLNPLHVDPAAAAAVPASGSRPILHGLCSFGVAELLLRRMGGPLRALSCRFASPAWPGDRLRLEAWPGPERWAFRMDAGGEEVLSAGIAEFRDTYRG